MAGSLTLAAQTLFAELLQRCLDADFDDFYDERGHFTRKRVRGRTYWYHQRKIGGKMVSTYVGPVTDNSIAGRVERFAGIKSDFRERQEMVRALAATGLPTPDTMSGPITEAMWKAGFFRLRGVLVGTVAFQAYAGPLGIKLGSRPLQTQDVDFAQFWGISENIGDSMPPVIEVLKGVDDSFEGVPTVRDPFVSAAYRNSRGYRVDMLAANRDAHQDRPARMKAPGGSGAHPVRHLDFLIHDPERSVLLTGGGIPVALPRAERYAVHKLIVATERRDQLKSAKDILQASILIETLASRRPLELAKAWHEACNSGPRWRAKLEAGRARLDGGTENHLVEVLEKQAASRKRLRAAT